MPTKCNRWYLLQILLLALHVSGTIMPIISSSRVLYRWSLPVVFGALVFKLSVWCGASASHHTDNLKTKAPNTTGSDHLYNTLELLMMGIMVPETCWASNKICNKYHLLHLVGILFPHIPDISLFTESDVPCLWVVYTCLGWRWPTFVETCCFNKHRNSDVLKVNKLYSYSRITQRDVYPTGVYSGWGS